MTPFNTARKAMLHLLDLFPASEDGQAPSPVRTLLLDIDSYLETLPALEITQRDEALMSARAMVREQRMLLKIAELNETIADMRCVNAARSDFINNGRSIENLHKFYRTDSAAALIVALCGHVERLQDDLQKIPLGTLAPVQVRA